MEDEEEQLLHQITGFNSRIIDTLTSGVRAADLSDNIHNLSSRIKAHGRHDITLSLPVTHPHPSRHLRVEFWNLAYSRRSSTEKRSETKPEAPSESGFSSDFCRSNSRFYSLFTTSFLPKASSSSKILNSLLTPICS